MKKLEEIFSKLGLNRANGLFLREDNHWRNEVAFPNRVKRLIDRKILPDAFFCFDNKPMILFFDNPKNKPELHEAIWNFNECPVAIIIENGAVEILNGFSIDKNTRLLRLLGGENDLNDFSYFELVTGRTWEQYKEDLHFENRVDYHLLQNIRAARRILVGDNVNRAKLANALLGKAIFVRYLIDRKVKMKFDGKLRPWTNKEFCELLDDSKKVQSFFEYIEDKNRGFNGELFPLSLEEYQQVNINDYQVLKRLLLGEDIGSRQPSLFDLYDFSIIPIEFISNVYELFIGQDNQRKEGAYYTPLFLVDYILNETVEIGLNKANRIKIKIDQLLSEEPGILSYCKVLDPSCGSGIFLVETLRKIIEKHIEITGIQVKAERFKTVIKNLAQENIYGIDKDESAVQVAIFSIYLTLLDYLEPPGIETFKFPVLLNKNFFVADFFDETADFNAQLQDIEFDYILGNPPWKGGGMKEVGNAYLKSRINKEKESKKKHKPAVNNNEIAEGFVLRVSDFCKKDTRVGLIIRSSSLYNLGYKSEEFSLFRKYLLEEYFIDKVFELAPVRYEVFEKSNQPAVAPAAVIFYRYANGENTDSNIIHHISLKQSRFFSLFKIFTINRSDYQLVQQKKLKEFDWLWKVLVYGSYLDFNFISRLKKSFKSIRNVVTDQSKFIQSTGLHFRTTKLEKPKDTSQIEGLPFLKTDAFSAFFINYSLEGELDKERIDIVKDARIYMQPMLLIREGIDMNALTAKSAISDKDILFKGSITSVKAFSTDGVRELLNIAAVFSSNIFSYYAINVFTTIGIERERVPNYNKYSLPYLELDVEKSVEKIKQAKSDIHIENKQTLVDTDNVEHLQRMVDSELDKINKSVYKQLQIDDTELALIDYALEVNRTMIVGKDRDKKKLFSSIVYEDQFLEEYALTFIDRFKSGLETDSTKFVVEIWHTRQIVGMLFKVVPAKEFKNDFVWINKQNSDWELLSFLSKISSESITEKLFVQKDVRGFEEDFFYIFKPNERRLWHKAIGYLDVNEFADAILKAGKERK